MQKFQAYLKMIISTFKEQRFQNNMTFLEKSLFNFTIYQQDLSLMTLKTTETKTQ